MAEDLGDDIGIGEEGEHEHRQAWRRAAGVVANRMGVGERDEGSQAAEEVEWLNDQVGGPLGARPRTAQAVDDLAVGASGEALLGEGSAQSVAEKSLQGFPIVSGDGL